MTSTGTNVTWIDPPEGWRYGFPRPYDPAPGETFDEWFLRMGYPKAKLHLARGYSRYWKAPNPPPAGGA